MKNRYIKTLGFFLLTMSMVPSSTARSLIPSNPNEQEKLKNFLLYVDYEIRRNRKMEEGESLFTTLFKGPGRLASNILDAASRNADNLSTTAYETARKAGASIEDAQKAGFAAGRKAILEGISNAASVLSGAVWAALDATGINFTKALIILTATPVALYGAKVGIDFAKEYYILRMSTPKLVRSILTPKQITKSLSDLLYTGRTNRQIQRAIKTAKGVVENKQTGYFHRINPFRDTSKGRARFENLMLWGPPGTGKTAIVEIIAKEAGMNLFVTSGGDFAKLRGKDLQQIDELFKTMRTSGRPCLLFIDEMEDLFGARGNKSEESRQIFTKLLTEFSEPSNQIMLIGATNRPEDIDEAMHRRMPVQIEVAYPDKAGRVKIFKLYKEIFFDKDSMYSKAKLAEINTVFTDKAIQEMEETMGKISPAEIANIMGSIKNRSLTDNKGIPTQAIIDEVLNDKKEQLNAIRYGFKRSDVETVPLELQAAPAV